MDEAQVIDCYLKHRQIYLVCRELKLVAAEVYRVLRNHNIAKIPYSDFIIQDAYIKYKSTPYSTVCDFTDIGPGQINKQKFIKFLKSKNEDVRCYSRAVILNDNYAKCYLDIKNAIKIFNRRKCWVDVASAYNLETQVSARSVFKYAGVEVICKRKISAAKVVNKDSEIAALYTDKFYSIGKLAQTYNTSKYVIRKVLVNNNVILRTKRHSCILNNSLEEHARAAFLGSVYSKQYILPSGKIIKCQGYEDDFLTHIFRNDILAEDDICYQAPRIPYTKDSEAIHYYYPDFYIPKFNMLIEIKS